MDKILQEFRDDILNNVNAKECAPELRRQGVIAVSTETKIARAKDKKTACGILYDHLLEECTFEQIVMLTKVLMEVDCGFGRTREVGQRLHERVLGIHGGGTDRQVSLHRSQLPLLLLKNEASTGNYGELHSTHKL